MIDDQLTGQMDVWDVIAEIQREATDVEVHVLASTQDPVSECVATCECVADCEIAGHCLLSLGLIG